MFNNWKELIPVEFAPESRVWIYQSSRLFSLTEALQIEGLLEDFVTHWQSHGTPVKGYANLLFGQFVVLMADESVSGVSGCSTDSSVRLIREIERLFNVNMFDRQALAFIKKEKVELIPLSQFSYAVDAGLIGPDTLYFNNLVASKQALLDEWIIPVKESWLAKRFPLLNADVA
ncbi:MAG TPA: hypothetical protein VK907_11460 [Phnomibacter sp.]|nr:hypothetical protein [Phnomibacter sp.]